MSVYLIVLVIIMAASLVSISRKYERPLYYISLVLLTVMLALRYGQGTDWFSYNYIFLQAPTSLDFTSSYYGTAVHCEPGWKLLNNVMRVFGLSFTALTIPLSIIEMLLVHRFLSRFAPNRSLGLLMLYPTVYLTYFFSVLRQGLVIAVFLGLMIGWLLDKHYGRYVLCALALCSIHVLSIVLILPLLLLRLPKKSVTIMVAICAIVGMTGGIWLPLISSVFANYYSQNFIISFQAIGYRCASVLLVYFLYQSAKDELNSDERQTVDTLFVIYLIGFSTYLVCMYSDIISSRLSAQMLALDSVLIPMLLTKDKARQRFLYLFVLASLVMVMTVKNLDSYIQQGSYNTDVTVMNYPYVSVFNQNDIYLYRTTKYILLQ